MKKLVLTLMAILTVSMYLSPVVKAQNPCSAGFQYVVGTVTPNGAPVSFYDSSFTVGSITNWSWSFGNGTGSTLQNPVATLNPGNNYVCLTITAVYQNQTCTSTYCDTVFVGGSPSPCNPSFTYNASALSVSFMGATGSNASWAWSFGDSTTGTGVNPSHTYAAAGTYTVCLTVLDAITGLSCTSCQTITVGGTVPCNANFTYAASPQGVLFAAMVNTGNVSWDWSFGDGTSGSGFNVFHTYTTPGTYTACLTVVDAAGVSCTTCQTITVGSTPGCQAYFTSSTIPGTTLYSFTNQSQGNATYFYWNFGDGTSSTLQNPTHSYTTTGWYNVCLTIIDSIAGCSDTYCDSLYVGNGFLCDPTFSVQNSPAATVFFATMPNASYSWDFGDGNVGTGAIITHIYSAPGSYNACLTVTTSNGLTCTSCQTVVIQSGSGCSSNFAIYPDSLTPHTYWAYNLASGVAPLTYTWNWGDSTSSTGAYPSHTYASAGLYTICLTISDATGCSSTTCYQWQLLRLSGSGVPVTINVIPGTVGLNEPQPISDMSVFPNPASDLISTSFYLAKESSVTINIMNLAGQNVFSLPSTAYGIGSHEIKMDAAGLPKGMYMIEIQSDGFKSNQKVIIQ